jgi:hypothetical protein
MPLFCDVTGHVLYDRLKPNGYLSFVVLSDTYYHFYNTVKYIAIYIVQLLPCTCIKMHTGA